MTNSELRQDALNRALRTFLVAMVVAVFIDVWPIVDEALAGTGPIEWGEVLRASLRVGLQAAGSFVLRRVIDPSPLPSPLPPVPATAPAPPQLPPAPAPAPEPAPVG